MEKTAVIGIGNILKKDDGVGVRVIEKLMEEELPSTAELVDGGTSTLDTLGYFVDFKKVIVVDSLKAGYEPGTIYKISPEDISQYKKENLSIHDVQILDVVKMANLLGSFPKVTIYGIEPKEISFDLELSETMKSKMPEIVKLIKKDLGI